MIDELIFKQTCRNRHFELQVANLHRNGLIPLPIYLSVGQEHIPAAIAQTGKQWAIFPQHRCHAYYLSFGGDATALFRELLGQPNGCNQGMGGSASISLPGVIFGHSGLLGDNLAIAAGYAHASQQSTLVVAGDAAVEEDYALAALGYIATHHLPVLCIVEDNNLSILTKTSTRRSWHIVDVARGFGLNAKEINDDPLIVYDEVNNIKLPALLNVRTCRHHV